MSKLSPFADVNKMVLHYRSVIEFLLLEYCQIMLYPYFALSV